MAPMTPAKGPYLGSFGPGLGPHRALLKTAKTVTQPLRYEGPLPPPRWLQTCLGRDGKKSPGRSPGVCFPF